LSWVSTFPAGVATWELVATLARERRVLTSTLVEQLRRRGAQPERIGGVFMIRSDQWAEVAPLLDTPAPTDSGQIKAESLSSQEMTPSPDEISQALARQDEHLRELKEQLASLLAQRGGAR
jgi:hypothetical protein